MAPILLYGCAYKDNKAHLFLHCDNKTKQKIKSAVHWRVSHPAAVDSSHCSLQPH